MIHSECVILVKCNRTNVHGKQKQMEHKDRWGSFIVKCRESCRASDYLVL